jgi:hypothetical protein
LQFHKDACEDESIVVASASLGFFIRTKNETKETSVSVVSVENLNLMTMENIKEIERGRENDD